MQNYHKAHLSTLVASFAILLLSILVPASKSLDNAWIPQSSVFPAMTFGGYGAEASGPDTPTEKALTRVAMRMSKRIVRDKGTSPSISTLLGALQEQRELLRHSTTVTLQLADNLSYRVWEVNLQSYPTWLKAEISPASAHFTVDEERIAEYLNRETIDGIIRPIAVIIAGTELNDGIERAITGTGAARPGLVFDIPTITRDLKSALTEGTEAITEPLTAAEGPVENLSGVPLGDLVLLGTGKSDLKGSPGARIYNVNKAIDQHVNNTLVSPGATFSFNDTLGGPVTNGNGWRDAKVIFNTTDLVMAPGGGICQASTTTFRAMLNAGFSAVKRANHSMYVTYYEKYGVGIDATVYPGKQDLTFVNDTGNYLLFQAYTEGTEVVVQIYGTPDGRETQVSGPYFSSSDFYDFPAGERTPRSNEIAWVQHVTFPDGTAKDDVIVSRYTSLPRSVAVKYETLHASAKKELSAAAQ